jgi:hypothetical protein
MASMAGRAKKILATITFSLPCATLACASKQTPLLGEKRTST